MSTSRIRTLAPTLACLLALAGAAPLAAQDDAAAARAGIDATSRRFEAAWKNSDAAGIAALYTADASIYPPGSLPISGREHIQTFWAGAFEAGLDEIELSTTSVDARGDMAVETGKATLRSGGEIVDIANFMVLWKREGGEWYLFRDIWNSQRASQE